MTRRDHGAVAGLVLAVHRGLHGRGREGGQRARGHGREGLVWQRDRGPHEVRGLGWRGGVAVAGARLEVVDRVDGVAARDGHGSPRPPAAGVARVTRVAGVVSASRTSGPSAVTSVPRPIVAAGVMVGGEGTAGTHGAVRAAVVRGGAEGVVAGVPGRVVGGREAQAGDGGGEALAHGDQGLHLVDPLALTPLVLEPDLYHALRQTRIFGQFFKHLWCRLWVLIEAVF